VVARIATASKTGRKSAILALLVATAVTVLIAMIKAAPKPTAVIRGAATRSARVRELATKPTTTKGTTPRATETAAMIRVRLSAVAVVAAEAEAGVVSRKRWWA
jgi:hypothetical protein